MQIKFQTFHKMAFTTHYRKCLRVGQGADPEKKIYSGAPIYYYQKGFANAFRYNIMSERGALFISASVCARIIGAKRVKSN